MLLAAKPNHLPVMAHAKGWLAIAANGDLLVAASQRAQSVKGIGLVCHLHRTVGVAPHLFKVALGVDFHFEFASFFFGRADGVEVAERQIAGAA